MSEFNAKQALSNVRKSCGSNRRLRSAAWALLGDITALACGLRPGVLVDYVVVDPNQLATVVAACLEQLPAGFRSPPLCVAVLSDCCLVVDPKAAQTLNPRFVEFSARPGGGFFSRWATEAEETALSKKIATVQNALLATCANAGEAVNIVSLDELHDAPVMPTLNGCLLGYPVVYAVHDMPGATAASRCLSTSTLRLCSVATRLMDAPEGELSKEALPLLAFSLPTELEGSGEWAERRQRWEEELRRRHAAAVRAGVPWSPLAVAETSCMRGVAL